VSGQDDDAVPAAVPVGDGNYTVQPGDGMSSIAERHGFFADTLWNLPQNAALKSARKSAEVLLPGDRVHVPDLRQKQESRPVDLVHQFKRKGVPVEIRFSVVEEGGRVFADKSYTLSIGQRRYEGRTDAKGELRHWVSPSSHNGTLTVTLDEPGYPSRLVRELRIGHLQPVESVAGYQARLQNLGYYTGLVSGTETEATRDAIRRFQGAEGLNATGEADQETLDALLARHGN